MSAKESPQRVAFSPGEFAALFGKSQTWGYRQLYAGKVKAITEHGRILIPAAEVERILGTAGTYNGLKPKLEVPRSGNKLDAWRLFIAARRKSKTTNQKGAVATVLTRLRSADGNARDSALARLRRRPSK
jgi:hypothetical protein